MLEIPPSLFETQRAEDGAWVRNLPTLAAEMLDRWSLRLDGPVAHGMAGIVLPVVRPDGLAAALKLQPVEEESKDVAVGLRTWAGQGTVLLLDHDERTGAMLLERLDATRSLATVADDTAALDILAGLLARLTAVPAPPGVGHLSDVAAAMLAQVPTAVSALRDPDEQALVRDCAAATAELLPEPGDRLLHWDLHYDNILAGTREPWLAIDPQPLAGDPGFDLLPALDNRWDEVLATGNPEKAVLRRFDQLTEALSMDRDRAVGWTMARVLQNALWDIEDGKTALHPVQVTIAVATKERASPGRLARSAGSVSSGPTCTGAGPLSP
jgi:streptomycin 6-kinase